MNLLLRNDTEIIKMENGKIFFRNKRKVELFVQI